MHFPFTRRFLFAILWMVGEFSNFHNRWKIIHLFALTNYPVRYWCVPSVWITSAVLYYKSNYFVWKLDTLIQSCQLSCFINCYWSSCITVKDAEYCKFSGIISVVAVIAYASNVKSIQIICELIACRKLTLLPINFAYCIQNSPKPTTFPIFPNFITCSNNS